MGECLYSQPLTLVARDGSNTVVQRCVKPEAEAFCHNVVSSTCKACPHHTVRAEAVPEPVVPMEKPEATTRLGPTVSGVWKCPRCGYAFRGNGTHIHRCPKASKDGSVPNVPSIAKRLQSYEIALQKWKDAGCPVRTDEQVTACVAVCEKCDWFDQQRRICRSCGCRVNHSTWAVVNKARMATETCPQNKW